MSDNNSIFDDEDQDPTPENTPPPAPAIDLKAQIRDAVAEVMREMAPTMPQSDAQPEEEEELSYDPREIQKRSVAAAGKLAAECSSLAAAARRQLTTEFNELGAEKIDEIIGNIQLMGPEEAIRLFKTKGHAVHATHEIGKLYKEGKIGSKSPKPLSPTGIGPSAAPKTDADQQLIREYTAINGRKPKGRELDILLGRI